jgi:hypothetical protein
MNPSDLPHDELLETAVFGKEVENFLSTKIGKYLVSRAEVQAEEATERLKRTPAWRKRKITDLQNEIWKAESFQQWLADAVMDGQQALNLIEGD